MGKKQSTIYLQSDVYSWLVSYKEKNGLSNISVAIERLILERIFQEQGNLNMSNISIEQKEKEIKKEEKKLPPSILNIKNSMK